MAFRWYVSPGFRSLLLSSSTPVKLTFSPTVHRTLSKSLSFRSSSAPLSSFSRLKTWTRTWLWIFPVAGGTLLYISPNPQLQLSTVFASPTLIPCVDTQPSIKDLANEDMISAPAEPHLPILSRVLDLFLDYIWEPVLTAKRLVHLLYLFLPVIITLPVLLVGKPEKELQGDRWGAVWWYGLLVSKMQAAGPTFIKLAQWAASRPDLFSAVLCDKMGATHSSVQPHSFAYTKYVLEEVFQRSFEDVFEEFDETPIGTGAIAQVYKATLKPDLIPPSYLEPKRHPKSAVGSLAPVIIDKPPPSVPTAAVAVKVLHPRVAKLIARDLSIMSFFAHIITLFPGMQWISLPEEVSVFGEMMRRQLDLRHEAENLIVFENNFSSRSLPLTFPRPLREFSTSELLIEQHETALPMELFLKHGGGPFDDQMATVGLNAFLSMLLLDNFVHADLHPGNIMVKFTKPPTTYDLLCCAIDKIFAWGDEVSLFHHQSESDRVVSELQGLRDKPVEWREKLQKIAGEGYIPEIVFIDAGLVTTLNSMNRKNFLDLFRAVAEFDGYRVGQLMIERCRTPHLAIDAETFALKMQHIVLGVKRKTFSLGQIRISDILRDVLRAVRQHHVKMEGDFINTVISILLLEGIGRQLDPSLDLFQSALPILRQLGRQMTAQESITRLPSGNLGALLKVWVWVEARQMASTAFVDVDDMVKYDRLMPSI